MGNLCDHCGKERKVSTHCLLKKNGDTMTEIELCDECLNILKTSDVWLETIRGYGRISANAENLDKMSCDHCADKNGTHVKRARTENGRVISVCLCDRCLDTFENSNDLLGTKKGSVKLVSLLSESRNSYRESEIKSSIGWTNIVKGLNIILFIALIIIGVIVGASLGDAMFYDEGAAVAGGFIGLILGAVIGGIVVSFSMLFVEISQNLAAVLDEIRK